MKAKHRFKKAIKYLLFSTVAVAILTIASFYWIEKQSAHRVYTSLSDLPSRKVGLVLGTGRLSKGKYLNPYYKYRISAAADLYRSGKVKHLLLSGDNSRKSYDEPTDMLHDLMKLGVPREAMTLDYAGFRTLDSVVRSKEVFQQEKLIVISQDFHVRRALFIANKYDIDAVGYAATMPSRVRKVLLREYLARVKAVIDLYLLQKQPKFLGEKITIPI